MPPFFFGDDYTIEAKVMSNDIYMSYKLTCFHVHRFSTSAA